MDNGTAPERPEGTKMKPRRPTSSAPTPSAENRSREAPRALDLPSTIFCARSIVPSSFMSTVKKMPMLFGSPGRARRSG
jgi:hypothetical protein